MIIAARKWLARLTVGSILLGVKTYSLSAPFRHLAKPTSNKNAVLQCGPVKG